jgi:hypothetical protein
MKYYALDSRRLSFADYWNLVSPATVLIPWIAKFLGIRIDFGAPNPQPESFGDLLVDPFDLSDTARLKLVPLIDQLRALGFHNALFQRLQNPHSTGDNGAAVMLDGTRAIVAKVLWTKTVTGGRVGEACDVYLLSQAENGDWIETTNATNGFAPLSWMHVVKKRGASLQQLWESHSRRLEVLSRTMPVRSFRDQASYESFLDELEVRAFRERLARGAYVQVAAPGIAPAAPRNTVAPAMECGQAAMM